MNVKYVHGVGPHVFDRVHLVGKEEGTLMANDSHVRTPSAVPPESRGGVALDQGTSAAQQNTAQATPPVLARPKTVAQQVSEAAKDWRESLVALAGDSSLANVALLGDSVLNLTQAHPSGIAQLFAGRPTRLVNIFREAASLPLARSRTRSVANHAQAQSEKYGISATYLAIGVATWVEHDNPDPENDVAALARVAGSRPAEQPSGTPKPPRVVKAPVLLRPISIAARSGNADYELALEPSAEINPILARALRSRGALLDPAALARGAFTGAGFDPSTALDRLNSLGQAVLPEFEMKDTLLVGSFVHPGQALVDDLDDLHSNLAQHEVVAALAGSTKAQESLKVDLGTATTHDLPPNAERGVGDLDASSRHALEALATGSHLFIDAPIGADTTGVAAAIIAEAAATGRNVLYVPGHRRAAVDLTARLRSLDLEDLLLDVVPSPNWRTLVTRRLLSAMTLAEPELNEDAIVALRVELEQTRTRLESMVSGLHEVHQPWNISAYDALQALARLTAQNPAPSTKVRFDTDTLLRIASGLRERISEDLYKAHELNAFTIRPTSTPWFGANLTTSQEATHALAHVTGLVSSEHTSSALESMRKHITRVAEFTGLNEATTLAQWTEQLQMIEGIREILDQFQPLVFESSVDDIVAATATKQWREEHNVELGGVQRRRLIKRAKDMVRPGMRVADLHESFVAIKAQRSKWNEHSENSSWPRLPEGLREILDNFSVVNTHIAALEPVLATTPLGGDLAQVEITALEERLEQLLQDSQALDTLPQRTAILRGLVNIGLGDLLKDFTKRRIEAPAMDNELDLAWWASVCEQLLSANPFLREDPEHDFEKFAQKFRELDRAHVSSLSRLIKSAAIKVNQDTLRAYRTQGEGLFTMLVEERLTSVRSAYEQFSAVMRKLRPCTIATATMVPHLFPAHRSIDLVILDAVQHMPTEQLLSAIARGQQIVVIGDPRSAAGGAIDALHEVLPSVSLIGNAVQRDAALTGFLMKHGYGDVLKPLPLPKPTSLVHYEEVYGTGMPNQKFGAVLSTEAEVSRVVDLIIEHVLDRSNESLAVIAGSAQHAERIREALELQKRNNTVLTNFFDSGRLEPAIVSDLSEVAGLSRDAVILTLGFGRTPHGRTLHRFGAISEANGDGLLLNALGVTRRRLTVVSCFNNSDLDVSRLRTPGSRLLASLLDFASGGSGDALPALEDIASAEAASTSARIAAAKTAARVASPEISDEQASSSVDSGKSEGSLPEDLSSEAPTSHDSSNHEPSSQEPSDENSALESNDSSSNDSGNLGSGENGSEETVSEQTETQTQETLFDVADNAGEPAKPAKTSAERTAHTEAEGELALEDAELVDNLDDHDGPTLNDDGTEPDRLLVDIADRLWQSGLTVETNYGHHSSERIPLVAGHPDYPDEYFVAVLTDDQNYINETSIRTRDRHRIERLESLGWTVVTLWSVPLFLDPASQANLVREAVFRIDAERKAAAKRALPAPPIPEDATDKVLAHETAELALQDIDSLLAADDVSVEFSGGAVQPSLFADARPPRPDVPFGLPINAYGDNQLDELVAWICTDGEERDEEELSALVREELGIRRRSHRVDTAISNAIRRSDV